MHENHRERLRERFLSEGLDSFEPHQALELLLFYAIPRRDTNELAHRLLTRFGSFSGVLDAHPADLESVDGMGKRSAALLSLLKPLWRLYRLENAKRGPVLENCGDVCAYAEQLFFGMQNEEFHLLCLDSGNRLIRDILLGSGAVDEVAVHPRAVVETALRGNAAQVILLHNHPKGPSVPSSADIAYTRLLASTLSTIGIRLADHVIVGEDGAYSISREACVDVP